MKTCCKKVRAKFLRAIAAEARERDNLGLKEEAHALRWVADAIKASMDAKG